MLQISHLCPFHHQMDRPAQGLLLGGSAVGRPR
ncbi:hypothetical protein T4A_11186 [Trichinella pseudospiralis]|uniref:Uncharacterized protein n=1 Tax=Trichinella pseudospiralis TaxID=6337 RepID=A0A0V1AHQ3_TRIPS|nr:hypothetical protein T4A_11186 [Trichinella pseudospiralis]